jgi:hypothetical protein
MAIPSESKRPGHAPPDSAAHATGGPGGNRYTADDFDRFAAEYRPSWEPPPPGSATAPAPNAVQAAPIIAVEAPPPSPAAASIADAEAIPLVAPVTTPAVAEGIEANPSPASVPSPTPSEPAPRSTRTPRESDAQVFAAAHAPPSRVDVTEPQDSIIVAREAPAPALPPLVPVEHPMNIAPAVSPVRSSAIDTVQTEAIPLRSSRKGVVFALVGVAALAAGAFFVFKPSGEPAAVTTDTAAQARPADPPSKSADVPPPEAVAMPTKAPTTSQPAPARNAPTPTPGPTPASVAKASEPAATPNLPPTPVASPATSPKPTYSDRTTASAPSAKPPVRASAPAKAAAPSPRSGGNASAPVRKGGIVRDNPF